MKNRLLAALLLAACLILLTACGKTPSAAPTQPELPAQQPEDPQVVVMTDAEDPVDYTQNVFTWMYLSEGEGETLKALNSIDHTQYGTAGSSLQQTASAVDALQLTGKTDVETVLAEYLSGMNATQKDFFSFQWQMSVKKARDMLANPASYAGLLSDCGCGDVDLTAFTAEQLDATDKAVMTLLQDNGVTDVWKTAEQEPFLRWNP